MICSRIGTNAALARVSKRRDWKHVTEFDSVKIYSLVLKWRLSFSCSTMCSNTMVKGELLLLREALSFWWLTEVSGLDFNRGVLSSESEQLFVSLETRWLDWNSLNNACKYNPKIDATLYPKWTVHLWSWALARILMPRVESGGLGWSPGFASFYGTVGKSFQISLSHSPPKLAWKFASKSYQHFQCHL